MEEEEVGEENGGGAIFLRPAQKLGCRGFVISGDSRQFLLGHILNIST